MHRTRYMQIAPSGLPCLCGDLVHWAVILGMYVDGVTDCVISWYPLLTRR